MQVQLKVEHFDQLVAALRSVDKELPKQLRKGMNAVADLVADEAASVVPVRSGKLQSSIRPQSTAKEGRVVMRVAHAGWIDFGGTISPRGTPMTRDFRKRGRYLFKSADDLQPRIIKETERMLTRFLSKIDL